MFRYTTPLVAGLFTFCSINATAETVTAPNTNANQQQESTPTGLAVMPQRGLTMSEVERYYGQPQKKDPAVGKPPITRWHYDGFIVVFDTNYVIHSIASAD